MGIKRQKAFQRNTLHIGAAVLAAVISLSVLVQQAAAKTYVITDGSRTLTYTTSAADPAAVLGQAGVTLGAEDSYTTQSLEGGSAISVHRAHNITINYHGQTRKVVSTGETAGELLSRLELRVTGEDLVSHGMDDRTHEGMVLTIGTPVTLRETWTSTVPHGVRYCNDASLPKGTEEILVEGTDGELRCTGNVTYVGGVETSRETITETLVRPAVTQLIAVGTGTSQARDTAPIIGDGYITLPTGEVLTYYKTDTVRATAYTHTDEGCDMVTATGTSVHWGTVAVDPRYIPYGTRMFIMSSNGSYIYGIAVAEDCGGDIKGDRMDLYMPTFEQCMEFGRRRCTIYFLG